MVIWTSNSHRIKSHTFWSRWITFPEWIYFVALSNWYMMKRLWTSFRMVPRLITLCKSVSAKRATPSKCWTVCWAMVKQAAKYHISSFSCAFHLWPGQLNSITTTTGMLFLLTFLYIIFHFFCTAYFSWTTLKLEAANYLWKYTLPLSWKKLS